MSSTPSSIGLIGLGKMGLPLAQNLTDKGFSVHAYDLDASIRKHARENGIHVYQERASLIQALPAPRTLWLMIPAGQAVDETLEALIPLLSAGDTLIDGGNSHFRDSMRRATQLKDYGIHFLDCGTSGGLSGARNGACTMVGGEPAVFQRHAAIFEAVSVENGSLYTGPSGSGHFVKMVHNGIEYGMMQAIAEGFEVLHKGPFELDLPAVAGLWNHGSVIRSWLMELTESAFRKDDKLDGIRGVMHASGEGKWTVETALDFGVPTPVIALSLMMRFRSQEADSFAGKVVAALRHEFGGHKVEEKED